MGYAVVGHRYWGRPGGGQLVSAAFANALKVIGYVPVLASPADFDPGRYLDWFGIDLSGMPRVTMGFRLRTFGIYMRFLLSRPVGRAIRVYRPSVVVVDEPTYKPILSLKGEYGFRLIEYIHFPFEVYVDRRLRDLASRYSEDPYVQERYGRFPMNIYWGIYLKLLPHYLRRNPFTDADLVLTNSRWTAQVAKLVYGEEPIVLNPPVPPNVGFVREPRPFDVREPLVVMVGRFSEEKRYHWVISEVMPKLVKEVPGVRLVIFGGAGTPTANAYIERLRRLARDSGVDGAVEFRPDAPRKTINETMDKARAFLHATINEHWGIVVAEAMARALPPVVHRSGGAWTDLVEEGRFGMGYETADEAVEALAKLLTDAKAWQTIAQAIPARVSELTLEKFTERLGRYLVK